MWVSWPLAFDNKLHPGSKIPLHRVFADLFGQSLAGFQCLPRSLKHRKVNRQSILDACGLVYIGFSYIGVV